MRFYQYLPLPALLSFCPSGTTLPCISQLYVHSSHSCAHSRRCASNHRKYTLRERTRMQCECTNKQLLERIRRASTQAHLKDIHCVSHHLACPLHAIASFWRSKSLHNLGLGAITMRLKPSPSLPAHRHSCLQHLTRLASTNSATHNKVITRQFQQEYCRVRPNRPQVFCP
jgi:hypothetical protein